LSWNPRVWVLLGRGVGGNGQMLSLASALGWPHEAKRLTYNPLQAVPNLLLGASKLSLGRDADRLEPPWPDLVIGASRRSAPIARWIRRQSGGRTALVHLLHVQAPLRHFDLVVTLPQYRLPERENVMCVTGALNRVDPRRLEAAAGEWKDRFAGLPRPWIGVLVGGDSSSYRFDADVAARLGREASALARRENGSLLVTTSARTRGAAADALFASIDVPQYGYDWQADDVANPYLAYLAVADRFIVTVDSASLPMEACSTGKPVQVFAWPRSRGGEEVSPPLRGWRRWLVEQGLVKPSRDFAAYQRALRERGLVSSLGDDPAAGTASNVDDLERVVQRVRALLDARAPRPESPRP
jgi:mitochondrial fission protein ELM1